MIIILMFICICNAITERQVREAVAGGAHSMSDLQAQLGVASCCGCCSDTASEYLPGGRQAAYPAVHDMVETIEAAANDTALSTGFTEVVARRA